MQNASLENIVNYNDLKSLKNALKNYHAIYELASLGDNTALAIYIDLKSALKDAKFKGKQREYILAYYVDGYNIIEIATISDTYPQQVQKVLSAAVKKVREHLIGGKSVQ